MNSLQNRKGRIVHKGMVRITCLGLLAGFLMMCLTACASAEKEEQPLQESAEPLSERNISQADDESEETEEDPVMGQNAFYVTVGNSVFSGTFAENSGAKALKEMLEDGPITVDMRDYGGFEKVGSLDRSLPASDTRITTKAGDIVLYQGNQIVIFYGSNSWAYTRLGKIDDLSGWEEALGNGNISAVFSLEES